MTERVPVTVRAGRGGPRGGTVGPSGSRHGVPGRVLGDEGRGRSSDVRPGTGGRTPGLTRRGSVPETVAQMRVGVGVGGEKLPHKGVGSQGVETDGLPAVGVTVRQRV